MRRENRSRLPGSLALGKFYGTVTIRFEAGKLMHVETQARRTWRSQDLPDECDHERGEPRETTARRRWQRAVQPQNPRGSYCRWQSTVGEQNAGV